MLFEYGILCQKDFKNYVRNKSKGYDVLITTGIDYDDIIYYDAVNDVRKMINVKKPIFYLDIIEMHYIQNQQENIMVFIIILIIKVQCPFLKV